METFEKKWEEYDCNIGVDCLGKACETKCKKIAEHWYRAALEWMYEHRRYKQSLNGKYFSWHDKISRELEEKNELQTVEQNPQCREQGTEG